jgi:hypothetical protein
MVDASLGIGGNRPTLGWRLINDGAWLGQAAQPAPLRLTRSDYGGLMWIPPLFAAARIRARSERPYEPTIPTAPGAVRARAVRDVFATAGVHGPYRRECTYHEPDSDAPRLEPCAQSAMQRLCVSVSTSWSARSAARHNSQRSPGRASSQKSVTNVVMGTKPTRPTAPEGSAKGHTRREPGWCGSRRQLQGQKKGPVVHRPRRYAAENEGVGGVSGSRCYEHFADGLTAGEERCHSD